MANQDHLNVLKQGVAGWNQWRQEHPEIQPDLTGIDLADANLSGINLYKADLTAASLVRANLSNADLPNAYFVGANLSYARLRGSDLFHANFHHADLSDADLSGTSLQRTDLSRATLTRTNFTRASVEWVIFGDVDLQSARGLETVDHHGPSTIGIDTIYRSRGQIPEVFLRKAGVPETFFTNMRALVGSISPIDFYSCFISYSSQDQTFVKRLYADLQSKGVRCWFTPEDLKIGDRIRLRIDESIRLYDKLLLVLSQHSVASQWVEQEVETALSKERKEQRIVLFPIRLDKAVMEIEGGWPALIGNTRNIGDFTRWKRHDAYQKALDRLLHDLKAET